MSGQQSITPDNTVKMKQNRANKEQERLATTFPDLTLDTSKHPAKVTGTIWLDPEIGYRMNLIVPANYPADIPYLICDRKEIPWEIDRHVFSSGRACLCVNSEYRKRWLPGSDLTDFIERLVKPFFIGQVYYNAYGHWPPDWERSHDRGIIEAYKEFLAPIGSPSIDTIKGFMSLLARPDYPGYKEKCPCGSGKYLQNCHRKLFVELRNTIDPAHARMDYQMQFINPRNKSAS